MKKNEDSNYQQPSDDFSRQMAKLMTILKKILKTNKFNQEDVKKIFGEMKAGKDGVNMNVFFLTLMPMSPDDFEDFGVDFDEIFDEDFEREESEEELRFEISTHDQEFLKKHGIKF